MNTGNIIIMSPVTVGFQATFKMLFNKVILFCRPISEQSWIGNQGNDLVHHRRYASVQPADYLSSFHAVLFWGINHMTQLLKFHIYLFNCSVSLFPSAKRYIFITNYSKFRCSIIPVCNVDKSACQKAHMYGSHIIYADIFLTSIYLHWIRIIVRIQWVPIHRRYYALSSYTFSPCM